MNKAVHIKVFGIVQGVFFRKHTQNAAMRLGLNGWVRNCNDGSVEIEAEGEEKDLNDFVEWCRSGPDKALVTKLEMKETELKNYLTFEVRR